MGESERYRVSKQSGSRYAFVVDTKTSRTLERFDVLKGNGWERADRYCDSLNALAEMSVEAKKLGLE